MTQLHQLSETVSSSSSNLDSNGKDGSDTCRIVAGKLFDPYSLQFLPLRTIAVSKRSGIILSVEETNEQDISEIALGQSIDLRHLTVLPGFVDTHVHCELWVLFWRWLSWLWPSSFPTLIWWNFVEWPDHEREHRGKNHTCYCSCAKNVDGWIYYCEVCCIILKIGLPTQMTISTHRDLGTEGAEDADISLRKCLSGPNPLTPGPRYFCANRAIVCTGSYGELFFLNFSTQNWWNG